MTYKPIMIWQNNFSKHKLPVWGVISPRVETWKYFYVLNLLREVIYLFDTIFFKKSFYLKGNKIASS